MSRVERHEREKLSEKEVTEIPSHDKAPSTPDAKNTQPTSMQDLKPAKNKFKKGKPRKKTILTIVVSLIAINVIVVSAILLTRDLALKGDAEMSINVGEEFKDPGTNMQSKVSGKVDVDVPGDYTLTYTKGDQKVTRVVHVVDPANLVLGLYGDEQTRVKIGDPYIESGAYGIDKTSGPITEYKTSGEVDTSKEGSYEIKYTFKVGNLTKTIKRTVNVIAEKDFASDSDGISVLMYHYVYTADDKPASVNGNYILDTDLKAQLDYLQKNDYYFPSFTELRAYIDGKISLPEKSVILTFDDGAQYFLSYGLPILNEYKIPATSFLIGVQGGPEKVTEYASSYVAFESHSYDMHRPGGNVGHGGVISAMSKADIVSDLKKAADFTGANHAFAFPYGDITEDGKAAVAECGIECAFSTVYGRVEVGEDYRALDRIRVQGANSLESWIATL